MFKIEYLIYIYMALCASMMVFNIFYFLYNISEEKIQNNRKIGINKRIDRQLFLIRNNAKLNISDLKYLKKALKFSNSLIMLEYHLDKEQEETVKKYIDNIQYVFYELAPYYNKVDNIKKAYFAYLIGKYKISKGTKNSILINTLYNFLESESIYCRDSSFKAIVKISSEMDILKVLKKLNNTKYNYYSEMIEKGLMEYTGDKNNLAKIMWNNYKIFNENIKIAILMFITDIKSNYSEEFFELLEEDKVSEKEKIQILKYFQENHYLKIKDFLLNSLTKNKKKNMIIQCIKTMQEYAGDDIKAALINYIKYADWETKIEIANTLAVLGTSYTDLAEIYNGGDEITREILKYKVESHKYKLKKQVKIEVS